MESVGEKAFGLACLPPAWTLPFVVVSSELLTAYRNATDVERSRLIGGWSKHVQDAAARIGLRPQDSTLVRSSAISESLDERGRYHSTSGILREVDRALDACLSQLARDEELRAAQVHLIIQREIKPISAKGHLSNERRCYEEARDWLGEFEDLEHEYAETFRVNLRRWRREDHVATESKPLSCNLKALVQKVLSIPAWWGYRQGLRLHFEWVWDGQHVSIVQVDQAKGAPGIDPTKDPSFTQRRVPGYEPRCLARITAEHASKYNKIRNAHTYLHLGLPVADLFILDNPAILDTILLGNPTQTLVDDIVALVPGSLVIRTDIATDDTHKRQLLPRTNEVRNVDAATDFMRDTLRTMRAGGVTEPIAFIFHTFIPAAASAFTYAAPGQRKVRIEALWGLPEGLYYNSHDQIEVDTGSKDINAIQPDRLSVLRITKRPRFKRYFVAPDSNGNWVTKQIGQPWDWRLSIQKSTWIREIAWQSRRIAEFEQRPVSIMWFIGVPRWASKQPVFPWYHEPFDYERIGRAQASRRKTPFDRSCVIHTRADVDLLRREATATGTRVRHIRIQPREEVLLRDKDLLKTIGELAKQINAVILLEGGTLSHAYYQLMQTKAVVEVAHPFDIPEDAQEFNKLVRDHIPTRIRHGGELVRVRKLTGDPLLRALREKLVEEAFEVLDARNHDTIIEELADVEEVIDAILKQLKSKRRQLRTQQGTKRSRVGGFEQGYILVDTSNPSPGDPVVDEAVLPLTLTTATTSLDSAPQPVNPVKTSILAKWGDRRDHVSASEQLLSLVVSLVHEPWSADSREITLGGDNNEVVRARVRGKRIGATLQLEVSVFIPPRQLRLLE